MAWMLRDTYMYISLLIYDKEHAKAKKLNLKNNIE